MDFYYHIVHFNTTVSNIELLYLFIIESGNVQSQSLKCLRQV